MKPSDFSTFYQALYARAPFPWQTRLAQEVIESGWPKVIDLPTASGKTCAIDVAIFALAYSATKSRQTARRVFYLVDRRIVVDSTFEHCKHIARRLSNALQDQKRGILGDIAEHLCQLTIGNHSDSESEPLHVSILRGGMYREDAWVRSPLQATVCVSTLDQIGSRLLFRGYGVTPGSWPIHAGLIANDSLLILDEAHISRPFSQTLSSIERYCGSAWSEKTVGKGFSVVRMSATHDHASLEKIKLFHLNAQDSRNEILAARLKASKIAFLEEINDTEQDKQGVVARKLRFCAYELAWPSASKVDTTSNKQRQKRGEQSNARHHLPARVIAIVVNRVATARAVFELLRSDVESRKSEAILLTGRIRPYDRDVLLYEATVNDKPEGWLRYIKAAQDRPQLDRPLFVVATQTIEVGADLDFDALVTEIAPLDALKQRFGRIDRLGLRHTSRSFVVARYSSVARDADDWLYGPTLRTTWKLLTQIEENKTVDFGIDALRANLSKIHPELIQSALSTTLAPNAPVLLPAHVDALCQTSPRPAAEPHIPLLLHGEGVPAEVQIVWRADLPELEASDAEEKIIRCLEFLPPTSIEALSLPFATARRWLEAKVFRRSFTDEQTADLEGGAPEGRQPRNTPQQTIGLRWLGAECSHLIGADQLQPGDTIVVPASFGGIDSFGWNPESHAPVPDISEVCNRIVRRELVLRIPASGVPSWVHSGYCEEAQGWSRALTDTLVAAQNNDTLQDADVVQLLRSAPTTSWVEGLADLQTSELSITPHPVSGWVLGIERQLRNHNQKFESGNYDKFGGDDDDPSLQRSRNPIPLNRHLQAVGAELRLWCSMLRLEKLAATLCLAGDFHDVGKADPRFQTYLHRGNEVAALSLQEPLAKSQTAFFSRREHDRARKRSGLPPGFRHEALSTALIANSSVAPSIDKDLLLHLVGTHHGYGRPLLPPIEEEIEEEVRYELRSAVLSAAPNHHLHRLDRGWTDRFWRIVDRFGWWGSAYLEALVRLADRRVSEREQLKSYATQVPNTNALILRPSKVVPSTRSGICLDGVNGESPLGFLTALGALRILSQASPDRDIRLSWFWDGSWKPRVHGFRKPSELVESLWAALNNDRLSVASFLKHHLTGYANLTIPVAEFHTLLSELAPQTHRGNRFVMDLYAALGSDAYPTQKQLISDTALRTLSGAGHQDFLGCMRFLTKAVQQEHIEAALFARWSYLRGWRSLRWDPQEDRRYALRAQDPSSEKTESVPGANRLAFEALTLFPTFAAHRRVETRAFFKGIETVFSWPVWSVPITLKAVETLLSHCELVKEDPAEAKLRPLGVEEVFRSSRITVGHYRNFTPSRACWGATLAIAVGE